MNSPFLLTIHSLPKVIAVAVCALLASTIYATANDDEASREYVAGYMLWKEGEDAESKKDFRSAHEKYLKASVIFDSVFSRWASWNPRVVTYRRKKIREDIARVESFVPAADRRAAAVPADRPSYSKPGRPTQPARASAVDQRYSSGTNRTIANLEGQIRDLQGQRVNLLDRLDATNDTLKKTEHSLEQSRLAQTTMTEEIGRLRATGGGTLLEELEDKLDLEQKAYSQLDSEYRILRQQFVKSKKETALLMDERDKLQRERDDLKALVQRTGSGEIDRLIKENLTLKEELKEARGRIEKLAADNEGKDEEIASLKAKVTEVETQLAKLREENAEYHRRIVALSERLRKTAKQLDDALAKSREGVSDELVEENKLLRSVLVRQLKKQSLRRQQKELIVAELTKLQGVSGSLLANIEKLAGNGVKLTEDERALFEDSAILDFIGDADALDQTLYAESKGGDILELPKVTDNAGEKNAIGLNADLTKFAKAAAFDFMEGHLSESEATYERIHEVVPDNVYTLRNLGMVKIHLKKMDEAEHVLRKAVSLDHQDALSHYMLGHLYFLVEQNEKCIKAMETSLSLEPDLARAHFHLGAILLKEGDLSAAQGAFQKVLEIDPKFADAHYNLAWIALNSSPPDRRGARDHYRLNLRLGGGGDGAMERAIGS